MAGRVGDFDALVGSIAEQLSAWTGAEVYRDEQGLRVRMTPASGSRSFLSLGRHDESVFMDLFKIEFSTLIGAVSVDSEDAFWFVDEANATAIAGAWEMFDNGDLGVTGQLVFTDPGEAGLAEQAIELWSLQIEDRATTKS